VNDTAVDIDRCLHCDEVLVSTEQRWLEALNLTPDMLFVGRSEFPLPEPLDALGDNRLTWCGVNCFMQWIVSKAVAA
jgi:hypothetical protein